MNTTKRLQFRVEKRIDLSHNWSRDRTEKRANGSVGQKVSRGFRLSSLFQWRSKFEGWLFELLLPEISFLDPAWPSMPSSCAAEGCQNRLGSCSHRFFRFPLSDRGRSRRWVQSVCTHRPLDWTPASHHRICGAHFVSGQPSKDPRRVDFVPTVVNHRKGSLQKGRLSQQRADRIARRENFRFQEDQSKKEAVYVSPAQPTSVESPGETSQPSPECETSQPDPEGETAQPVVEEEILPPEEQSGCTSIPADSDCISCGVCGDLERQLQALTLKNKELERKLHDKEKGSTKPLLETIRDDAKTKFYTGLPTWTLLLGLFTYLEQKASRMHLWRGEKEERKHSECGVYGKGSGGSRSGRRLSLMEELLAVLVRLRLGLYTEDVCARFGISRSYYSKIFTTWIVFLSKELTLLFPWPSKDLIQRYTPAQFNIYPRTRVILDCTEIFIERPSLLKANCQAYSNYKSHSTFKALVGVSPSGAFTFVSDLWSGRASDKLLVQESGILDLLEAGDNVMADRGFEIEELLVERKVTLNIPPFLGRQRDQFSVGEVDETRKIASLRIHVERAIGRMKKFHILDGDLPITLAPIANHIFKVCAYLTNFSPPLVSS